MTYKNLDKSANFNLQGFTFSNQEFTSHETLVSFSVIGQCLKLDTRILSLIMSKLRFNYALMKKYTFTLN